MKKNLLIIALLTVSGTILAGNGYRLQPDIDKEEVLLHAIIQNLNQGHYDPVKVNDNFSEKAFDLYMKRLDFNKRFFLEDDVEQFEKYREVLDDEVELSSFEFFDLTHNTLTERIDLVEHMNYELLEKPFNYDRMEHLETDFEKLDYAKNERELKDKWRKYLKYQTMIRINNKMNKQERDAEKSDTVKIKSFDEIEESSRALVLKSQKDFFKRFKKLNRNDRLSIYINSLTGVYDPHTNYFPPKDKENFDISMSGRLEGIGARLQEKDGYIKVVSIVPGSASWKQGDLKEGDLITKVAQDGEDPVHVVDMRIDDVVKLIRGPKGTKVILTVQKLDGDIQEVPIVRDVVILEESYAKSAILESDINEDRIGYIKLPKFYADFNNKGGRSCARDVKLELEKLKAENVDGIILDLRNNGGGSLNDVVKIVGHFIPVGPVVQVNGRYGKPYVYRDNDSTVVYDGPLLVMVNGFSASASEILAAAIQDMNRGVVVGSASTFGKGTVQKFFDLDRAVVNESVKPLGSIKITTQKFYRINGSTTQLGGVEPDIVLPDSYMMIELGEKEHDYPMEHSSINPVLFPRFKQTYQMEDLIASSSDRISGSETFNLVQENAKRLKKNQDESALPLNWSEFREYRKSQKEESDKYGDIAQVIEGMEIITPTVDVPIIESDSVKIKRNENWHKTLQKDHFIYESLSIMNDMGE